MYQNTIFAPDPFLGTCKEKGKKGVALAGEQTSPQLLPRTVSDRPYTE